MKGSLLSSYTVILYDTITGPDGGLNTATVNYSYPYTMDQSGDMFFTVGGDPSRHGKNMQIPYRKA